ncbi:hypothetical protein RUND412_006892 [Rhizina undulata]
MFTKLAILSLFALEAHAFWRLPCRQSLVLERIDPITRNGEIGEHVHTVHGGNKFSKSADGDALLESTCSSCQVKQDNSAYWVPELYFHDTAGNFVGVNQTGGMLAYYLLRGDNITAFPPNFRMIAGDPTLRNFSYPNVEKSLWTDADRTQAALRQKAVGYNCLNYDEAANPALGLKAFPQGMECKDGVRSEVFFPSCWNGVDIDSDNHRDHMAYPSLLDDGTCPDGFPVRVASLFYEVIWDVYAFTGQAGEFVWSHGDPTGYGYHGDFMNGWQQTVLQSAIDTCTNLSGIITDCELFDLYTLEEMAECTIPSEVDEDAWGPLTKLPGCNPIVRGPEPAPTDCTDNEDAYSSLISSAAAVPIPSATSVPVLSSTGDYGYSVNYGYSSESVSGVGIEAVETTSSDPYLVVVTVTSYTTQQPITVTVDVEVAQTSAPVKRHIHKRHGHH